MFQCIGGLSFSEVLSDHSAYFLLVMPQAIPCHFKDIKEVITKNLGKDLSEV